MLQSLGGRDFRDREKRDGRIALVIAIFAFIVAFSALLDRIGAPPALVEALMAAHFTDGKDINDPDVLQALCTAVGLEVDVPAYLQTADGVDVVNEQQDAARAAGITSVPTYVFASRWGISGAQEVSTLEMVLAQVASQADAQPGGSGGGCCGGGCCG